MSQSPLCCRGRTFLPALLLALAASLVLGGCGPEEVSGSVTPSPTVKAAAPPLVANVCLDRSASYPTQDFDSAKNLLADAIMARASGAQGGATIYVTLVGKNSFATSSTLPTVVVPPIAPVSTGASGGNGNPFDASAAQTAAATAKAQQQAYQDAINSAQAKVKPSIDALRSLHPTPASGTDIIGCLARASERLNAAPAGSRKLLILASDMVATTDTQANVPHPLDGVKVKIIYFESSLDRDDAAVKAKWQAEFSRDNAEAPQFLEPAVMATVTPEMLFE